MGGKELLIKAIAQVIPIQTMSCFRIPLNICEDIDKICAKFWWEAFGDKRKIHWMSWKRLCANKCKEGMRFRDISAFNQAMFTKLSWRILRNPDFFLLKILHGRYFKDGDFLKALLGSNPSLTWSGVVWGRTLFKKVTAGRWKMVITLTLRTTYGLTDRGVVSQSSPITSSEVIKWLIL